MQLVASLFRVPASRNLNCDRNRKSWLVGGIGSGHWQSKIGLGLGSPAKWPLCRLTKLVAAAAAAAESTPPLDDQKLWAKC